MKVDCPAGRSYTKESDGWPKFWEEAGQRMVLSNGPGAGPIHPNK